MNKAVILRTSAILISVLLHLMVLFLSFRVDQPEEIEKLVPIFQMIDAIILEEPEIIVQPPPVTKPEIIEEINEAVIPDETIEEPPEEPKAEPKPESSEVNTDVASESLVQPAEAVYVPFYKVEKRPEFISQAELKYPLQAKRNRIEGTVIVEADIDKEGILQQVKIVKSAGFGFDEAATEMLENSSFSPAIMDGRPVGVRMRFTIQFKI